MTYTKYAAAAAALLVTCGSALANPVTDSITRQWDYTAPAEFNSPAPRAANAPTIACPAGQTALVGTMGVYCEYKPTGRFVQVDDVPQGYVGRVFYINTRQGRGTQGLGW
ncbi:hypothetical protein ATO10_11777 [Actibacterium atlanticum]|uniref:Uncharacterized protein n=1 Tax=Actibacterium atlanticum TaxID=1461693 RepID=A0A058ZK51_9RHOB|nr:hypothetical protein [Actibacterium atlanticum]KCV81590.1 hypothetical protein ATO10_11777 [Actibacterium atlanticum]